MSLTGCLEDDSDEELGAESEPCRHARSVYMRACKMFNVTPSNFFYRNLHQLEIPMQNHVIGATGAKAIATTLVRNSTVRVLDLTSTGLGTEGLTYIRDLLEENKTLTSINLSYNKLGTAGLRILADAFSSNQTIQLLDISGNDFTDQDSIYVSDIIENNVTLKCLRVSRNSFGDIAGQHIGKALEESTTLERLDVSWNHLRQAGAIDFCKGLQNNVSVRVLNLSWNGFGLEGCHELGKCLAVNRRLTELDVSANRVNYDAFKLVLRGLARNRRIKTLKIGHNPITTDGAVAILRAVADDKCCALKYLDMSHVSVDRHFVSLLGEVQAGRQLTVVHGTVLRQYELRRGGVPVVLDTDDPVTLLFEFVKTKNLRLIDFLKNLDKDGSETLSREELRRGLEEIDIPLSQRSMDILMNRLDMNRDGQVDFAELSVKYKEHVRRVSKLTREADIDLKHYKNFDKLQQIREAVRLRLRLATGTT